MQQDTKEAGPVWDRLAQALSYARSRRPAAPQPTSLELEIARHNAMVDAKKAAKRARKAKR